MMLTVFQTLIDTVQSLTTSKADHDQLEITVNKLNKTTAKQEDLHNLDRNVSSHILSSQQTHKQHDSRIRGNGHNNTEHIEDDIRQLKASSPGLAASWIPMIACTTLPLVIVCVLKY